jgi:DNA-binding NarL/FixJ family response regulator
MLMAFGAQGFAERAARELLATGETARQRIDETRDDLTPREAQIAQLAREGLSTSEIGARLVISTRTVEYHLTKVFAKLRISSRSQLHDVLAGVLSGPHASSDVFGARRRAAQGSPPLRRRTAGGLG